MAGLTLPFSTPCRADAAFSPCGRYRWWLRRCWQPQLPALLFIGLNPSRADDRRDDPTLRRLLGFCRQWGYGALEVVNLFGRISPAPASLRRSPDPVGEANDRWLQRALGAQLAAATPGQAGAIWLGWGNQGGWRQRDRELLRLLDRALAERDQRQALSLLCLGLTASGQPRHPLYVAAASAPQLLTLAQTDAAGASCGASLQLQR